MDERTDQNADRTASRRRVLASSAVGAAMFGASGLVGTAAAEETVEAGSHPTPEELERTLSNSKHIGLNPKYTDRIDKDAISSVSELDPAVTAGEGHPDVFFGEFNNTQTPSGHYYSLSDTRAEVDSGPGPISVDENDVEGNFFTFSKTLGCWSPVNIPFADDELCVEIGFGADIEVLGNGKIGGNLYVDFVFRHPGTGFEITVSPLGFGVYADPDEEFGTCVTFKVRAPGPIPGKLDVEVCIDHSFSIEGGDLVLGVGFSKFGLCVEDDLACADIFAPSLGFSWNVGIPYLSQEPVSPELPNGQEL